MESQLEQMRKLYNQMAAAERTVSRLGHWGVKMSLSAMPKDRFMTLLYSHAALRSHVDNQNEGWSKLIKYIGDPNKSFDGASLVAGGNKGVYSNDAGLGLSWPWPNKNPLGG
jgi:hypothetical protein